MSATCAEARERLDDHVDGLLDEDGRTAVEAHLLACEECRREERALRALVAEAAALARDVAPPNDLWPGIERRIRPGARAWLGHLAAAACILLAVAAAITARQPRGALPPEAATSAPQPAAQAAGDLQQLERDYERAASTLLAQMRSRRGHIPEETIAQVEDSLRTIDAALGQIRAALRQQPDEPALHLMLAATHRKKVEVLRRVMNASV